MHLCFILISEISDNNNDGKVADVYKNIYQRTKKIFEKLVSGDLTTEISESLGKGKIYCPQ